MKIISVVGEKPNFMKIAPFLRTIENHNNQLGEHGSSFIRHILVHTGQHYDEKMYRSFFEELGIPFADNNLNIGSGTHVEQYGANNDII